MVPNSTAVEFTSYLRMALVVRSFSVLQGSPDHITEVCFELLGRRMAINGVVAVLHAVCLPVCNDSSVRIEKGTFETP